MADENPSVTPEDAPPPVAVAEEASAEAPAPEADQEASAQDDAGRGGRKGQRHVPSGIAHVEATFNNTKVTITDQRGGVVAWSTAGRIGYKGSRKSTAYVAQLVGTDAAKRAASLGMRELEVRIKGPGAGREAAVRGITGSGMDVSILKDVTPIPHNGCRPPKRRRV